MNASSFQGRTALVTGASSGLGVDFAHDLARRGANLILVARREERLREVAGELKQRHGADATVISMDLGVEDAGQALYDAVQDRGLAVDVLVNNAGFGAHGSFLDIEWEREKAMLTLDILTPVHLCKLFAPDMRARGRGWILNVASIGAYQPSPTYASYSAAKSYVLYFTEALNYELKDTGVSATALSPGITRTEFLEVAGQEPSTYQKLTMMESEEVTRIGLAAMLKGTPSVVPGWANKLTAFTAQRLLPRRLAAWTAHLTMTT
jgi:short-subunit dehydrogenase